MKILFTSVGRRVELIQAFRSASNKLGCDLEIFGADISESAPALFFCDTREIVCRISNPNYIPTLLSICKNQKIDCLIPTIDTDLILLSQNKEKFEAVGTKVFVSECEKIEISRNKKRSASYFISLGLKAPDTYDSAEEFAEEYNIGKQKLPAFIKPNDGSSSVGVHRADNIEELMFYSRRVKNPIIQTCIEGREYSVDIFCDYNGNPVYITPRERLAVRAGEVSKTQIVQDDKIIEEMKVLVKDYKPCGQITVQLIRDKVTGDDYYIEINSRFGGGAPISMMAGADSAEAVLRILNGEKLTYHHKAARDGALYCRYDQSVCAN